MVPWAVIGHSVPVIMMVLLAVVNDIVYITATAGAFPLTVVSVFFFLYGATPLFGDLCSKCSQGETQRKKQNQKNLVKLKVICSVMALTLVPCICRLDLAIFIPPAETKEMECGL